MAPHVVQLILHLYTLHQDELQNRGVLHVREELCKAAPGLEHGLMLFRGWEAWKELDSD